MSRTVLIGRSCLSEKKACRSAESSNCPLVHLSICAAAGMPDAWTAASLPLCLILCMPFVLIITYKTKIDRSHIVCSRIAFMIKYQRNLLNRSCDSGPASRLGKMMLALPFVLHSNGLPPGSRARAYMMIGQSNSRRDGYLQSCPESHLWTCKFPDLSWYPSGWQVVCAHARIDDPPALRWV